MPRTAAAPDPERQLMIKTKICQRLLKEVGYYQKEVKENEAKLAAMKEGNRDPYDIKKFEEVLGESYMMIPDSQARLKKSLEDLSRFLQSDDFSSDESQQQQSEWMNTAKTILKDHMSSEKGEEQDCSGVQETNVDGLKDDEAF